jgi:hypothetical protein
MQKWKIKDAKLLDTITLHPLDSEITKDLLRRLQSELLLKDTVIGEIRWPKSWTTATVADRGSRFLLTLSYITKVLDLETGRTIKLNTTIMPFKTKNGPDDENYYRVSFMAPRLGAGTEYTIQILTLDQSLWPEPADEHRLVYPDSRVFVFGENGQVLDPFDVVRFKRVSINRVPRVPGL